MATTALFPEGFVLGDRYEIVRVIGQGGMGVVYLAKDQHLEDELRAIKTIRPELLADKKSTRVLKQEAVSAMRLSHHLIVTTHNFEQWNDLSYIVMEYIEGQTLADILLDKEKFASEEFYPIAGQICTALEFAHEEGFIHQDIKPSNIFIEKSGRVKIADFSIARLMKDATTRLTGVIPSGTLVYMSPEVLRGEKPTVASDIYSTGITFYEMLNGEPPFYRGDIFSQHQEIAPAVISEIPEHLNQAILSALSKNPEDRPASIAELGTLLVKDQPGSPPMGEQQPEMDQDDDSTASSAGLFDQGIKNLKQGAWLKAKESFDRAMKGIPTLEEMIEPVVERWKPKSDNDKNKQENTAYKDSETSQIDDYIAKAEHHILEGEWHQADKLYQKILNIDPLNEAALDGRKRVKEKLKRNSAEKSTKSKDERSMLRGIREAKDQEYVNRIKLKESRTYKWATGIALAIIALVVIMNWKTVKPWKINDDVPERLELSEAELARAEEIRGTQTSFPIGDTGTSIEMIKIPSKPEIAINNDFYLGIYEVTQKQYEAVMHKSSSHFGGSDRPVESVTWQDALDFCRRLSKITGDSYRLPTENEWEYACRAGTKTQFFWGYHESFAKEYAWFEKNSSDQTYFAGRLEPNHWGLYDMVGNVWELCSTGNKTVAFPSKSDSSDSDNFIDLVIRGGSYYSSVRFLEPDYQGRIPPYLKSKGSGFRVVREVEQ